MEIINSRYKILKKLNTQLSNIQEFLVVDLWSKNTQLNLKLISSLTLSKEEFNFFKNEFITMSSIDNYFYLKNYGFSSLHMTYPPINISNPDEILYVLTTEYVENKIPIFKFVRTCSMEDLLNIVVAVCQSLIHAGNMGFEYDVFKPDNVIIVKDKAGFKIRIKDIASTKLENNNSIRFIRAEDYSGISENIKTIGIFIISLLAGKEIKSNFHLTLSKLEEEYKSKKLTKSNHEIFTTLCNIAKNQIRNINKRKKTKIYHLIQEINKQLHRNYPANVITALNSLTFKPKLVGRDKEIQILSQSIEEINIRKPRKTIFFVKGAQGVGKTRFLKEAEYQLALKGGNIYSNYNLKTSSQKIFWNDFLEKIFLNSYSIEDINAKKNIIKNIEHISEHQNISSRKTDYQHVKFKVLNEAKNLFFKTIDKTACFIIIDDLELADDFILDALLYLATEVTELEKLGVILSYNETITPTSSKFKSFLKILSNYDKSQTFILNDFSEKESIEMVKNILLLKYLPMYLGPIIYKYTAGNPAFIIEMIKGFINNDILNIDKLTGMWFVTDEIYTEKVQKKIPTSIEDTLKNQVESLSIPEKKLLIEISVFQNTFRMEQIYELLSLSVKKIDTIVKKLVDRGLVTIIKKGNKLEYTITNKIMRDMLYNAIENQYRISQHKKISLILQKEKHINTDEFIWHLEESGNKKKALSYYLNIIDKNMKAKNINTVIKTYEKIPSIILSQNSKKKFRILLNIFVIYNQIGIKNKETEVRKMLEEIRPSINDSELLSYYYYTMAKHEYISLNEENILTYIKKQHELFKKIGKEIYYLRLQYSYCLYYHMRQDAPELKKVILNMLRITKNNPEYLLYRSATYIFLGHFYEIKYNKIKALKYFKKAKKTAYLCNNTRTELIAMYNISIIYWKTHPNIEKAIAYTKNVINISKNINFLILEIISLINYAEMLAENQDNHDAYEHAKYAENKIITHDIKTLKLPCITTLMKITQNLNYHKEFFKYRNIFIQTMKNNNISHKATYPYLFLFYSLTAQACQEFGKINKACFYFKKAISLKKYCYEKNIFIIYFIFESLKIIQRKKTDINNLIKIFNYYMDAKQFLNSNNRKFTKTFFDTIISLIFKCNNIDFTPLIKIILKYDNSKLKNFQLLGMYYLKTYISKNKTREIAYQNIEMMRQKRQINIDLFFNIALGEYYHSKNIKSTAVINFLEAQNKIKQILQNTPSKYRVKLFNSKSYNKPFDIVSAFIKGENILKENIKQRNITETELKSILKNNHINIIKKNKEFKKELIQTLLTQAGYEHITSVNIINNFTNDYIKNISMVMQFLAVNLISSNYDFLEINKSGKFNFILNNKDKNGYLKQIFNLILKFGYGNINKIEKMLCKPCMIVPVNKKNINGKNITQLGFMIFISEEIINNFSNDGKNLCQKHANLLTMLIESKNFQQTASFDPLTEAYTRKYLDFFLKKTIIGSSKTNSKFSIILYDLDKFKNINDTYGHLFGDIVLKKTSKTILETLENGQILSRYGGEEFLIVLPNADTVTALKIAEKIRKKIVNLKFTKFDINITISLGIASFPTHGQNIPELITKADQALYNSKNIGRNKSSIWSASLMHKKDTAINSCGVIIADESNFSKNIAATINFCNIIKQKQTKQQLIYYFIYEILKTFEAESGAIIKVIKNSTSKISNFKVISKIGFKSYSINKNLLHKAVHENTGFYQTDWNGAIERNNITNMPEWNSVMITPLIKNENIIGIIYIAAPEKKSDFNERRFSFFKFIADIIAANI